MRLTVDIPPCFFFFFVIIKVSRLRPCYNAGGVGLASKPPSGVRESLLEAFGFEALPFVQTMAVLLGQAAGEGSVPRSLRGPCWRCPQRPAAPTLPSQPPESIRNQSVGTAAVCLQLPELAAGCRNE